MISDKIVVLDGEKYMQQVRTVGRSFCLVASLEI
jgi:hypothetical protein